MTRSRNNFFHVNVSIANYNKVLCVKNFWQIVCIFFSGLSAREFILHWRHKALLLFKLLLLERRVIFYRSPVQSLCSNILTLLSLYPFMIERGLDQSACVK